MFLNRAVALLTCCAAGALAQSEPVRLLALNQTKYRLHAGEVTPVAAPRETFDFIRSARNRIARVNGVSGEGLVLGPSAKGDQMVLAASPLMKPGEYTVSLRAVSETGQERVMTLDVTLDPMQTTSLTTTPPLELSSWWQPPIDSTPALVAQGWVVLGGFEQRARVEVQSELVLGNQYDSLDAAASDRHSGAQ